MRTAYEPTSSRSRRSGALSHRRSVRARSVAQRAPSGHHALMSERSGDETTFMGVHLAVADMANAMEFYRRAGLHIPDGAEDAAHVDIKFGGGVHVAFSTPPVIAMYDPAWRGPNAST